MSIQTRHRNLETAEKWAIGGAFATVAVAAYALVRWWPTKQWITTDCSRSVTEQEFSPWWNLYGAKIMSRLVTGEYAKRLRNFYGCNPWGAGLGELIAEERACAKLWIDTIVLIVVKAATPCTSGLAYSSVRGLVRARLFDALPSKTEADEDPTTWLRPLWRLRMYWPY